MVCPQTPAATTSRTNVNEKNFPIDDHFIEYSLSRTSAILNFISTDGKENAALVADLEIFRNSRTLFNSWPATYPTTSQLFLLP